MSKAKRLISLILCSVLAFTLCSCAKPSEDEPEDDKEQITEEQEESEEEEESTGEAEETAQEAEATAESEPLEYKMVEETFNHYTSNGILVRYNTVSYPQFSGDSSFEKTITNRYSDIMRIYEEDSLSDNNELYDSAVENENDNLLPFFENVNVDIIYNKNGYFSFVDWTHEQTGGAHVYSSESPETYDIKTGEQLGYYSFFDCTEEEADAYIKEAGEAEGLNEYQLRDYAIGSDRFVLTDEGVMFYINVGDAVARQELVIKFTDEKHLLIDPDDADDDADESPLSNEELAYLFSQANSFYIGWLSHGFEAELDMDDSFTQNGTTYVRIKSGKYNSVDDIKDAAAKYFSEEIYADSIDSYYTMHDGKLYGLDSLGQGGDIPADSLTISVQKYTSDTIEFYVTANYGNSDSYTSVYKLKKDGFKWIFTDDFCGDLTLYYNNDIEITFE